MEMVDFFFLVKQEIKKPILKRYRFMTKNDLHLRVEWLIMGIIVIE